MFEVRRWREQQVGLRFQPQTWATTRAPDHLFWSSSCLWRGLSNPSWTEPTTRFDDGFKLCLMVQLNRWPNASHLFPFHSVGSWKSGQARQLSRQSRAPRLLELTLTRPDISVLSDQTTSKTVEVENLGIDVNTIRPKFWNYIVCNIKWNEKMKILTCISVWTYLFLVIN